MYTLSNHWIHMTDRVCNLHKQLRIGWVDEMSQDQSHLVASGCQPEIWVCERINSMHTIARIGRINGSVNTFKQFIIPELELSIGKFDVARHVACNRLFKCNSSWIHSVEFIYEFICSWIHIWISLNEFIAYEFIYEYDTMNSWCLNSCIWIQRILWIHIWIWHYEFMLSEFMYMNSEYALNSYTWIQRPWIHSVIFIYEFIAYEFIVSYSYMNSWKLWIHIWIWHYEFICYEFIKIFIYEFIDYEFIVSDSYMNS